MCSGSHPDLPPGPGRAGQRVLVVLVAGIGDFVLATPAIRALSRGFPDAEISFLTTPQTGDLARACPHFHDVVTFDLRAYRPGERGVGWTGWRAFRAMTAALHARRFSLVVNLYRVATWAGAVRMALLLSRIGGRATAGRWSGGRGVIFGLRSADTPHEMDAMLALAARLGCRSDDAGPTVWIPDASREAGVRCLQAAGIPPSSPYVVLHVGSNKPEARLPEERAADIGAAVGRALNAPVLVVGDASEVASAETVAARIGGGSRSVAGKTGLLELAAILEGARAAVVTDSGPMHLAAAVGTPLVALFGPGDPCSYGPRGRTGHVALIQGGQHPYDPARWHTDIRTDDVLDALRKRLNIAPFTALG